MQSRDSVNCLNMLIIRSLNIALSLSACDYVFVGRRRATVRQNDWLPENNMILHLVVCDFETGMK